MDTPKTCWEILKVHHSLLKGLGNSLVLREQTIKDAEKFFCRVYGAATASSTDEVHVSMFVNKITNEELPPTSDALLCHIKRSYYQAMVWRQTHLQHPVLLPPEKMGCKREGDTLIPELNLLPLVPNAYEELLRCTFNWLQNKSLQLKEG
jgi:hypothetical protein